MVSPLNDQRETTMTNLNKELSIEELDFVAGGCTHGSGDCSNGKGDGLGKLRQLEGAILDGVISVIKTIGGMIPH
jgi:hypothetical protein